MCILQTAKQLCSVGELPSQPTQVRALAVILCLSCLSHTPSTHTSLPSVSPGASHSVPASQSYACPRLSAATHPFPRWPCLSRSPRQDPLLLSLFCWVAAAPLCSPDMSMTAHLSVFQRGATEKAVSICTRQMQGSRVLFFFLPFSYYLLGRCVMCE